MEIIRTSVNDKKKLYKMTKGADIKRVQDYEGLETVVEDFVVFTDQKNDGSDMKVLCFESDTGIFLATNSPTFIQAFSDIIEVSGNIVGEKIKIVSSTSKAGRTFFTCVWC